MIDETQAAPASQPPTQGKINIGTMDVSDSDSDEEGQVCTFNECICNLYCSPVSQDWNNQAFYAGGSSTSGNVILGPKKKKFNVGDVFKVGQSLENRAHTNFRLREKLGQRRLLLVHLGVLEGQVAPGVESSPSELFFYKSCFNL